MKPKMSSRGQITLPAALRKQDAIRAGDQFEIERVKAGHYLLKVLPARNASGVVAWLLACPEKGWFTPMPSECADQL
jgi:AbrB family looped-hinge helix DNA binding protein